MLQVALFGMPGKADTIRMKHLARGQPRMIRSSAGNFIRLGNVVRNFR